MSAELVAHGRQQLVGKVGQPRELKRSYSAVVSTGRRHAFVDAGLDGPAAFARVRNAAGKLRQLRIGQQRRGRQVQQPRSDNAAAPPNLGHVGQIEVVLIMFRIAQRRGLGIDLALLLADVGGLQ